MAKRRGASPKAKGSGMVRYSTFLWPHQLEQMKAIQAAVGVTVAEQIRRAITAMLAVAEPSRQMNDAIVAARRAAVSKGGR
jgi:hypothetical protein